MKKFVLSIVAFALAGCNDSSSDNQLQANELKVNFSGYELIEPAIKVSSVDVQSQYKADSFVHVVDTHPYKVCIQDELMETASCYEGVDIATDTITETVWGDATITTEFTGDWVTISPDIDLVADPLLVPQGQQNAVVDMYTDRWALVTYEAEDQYPIDFANSGFTFLDDSEPWVNGYQQDGLTNFRYFYVNQGSQFKVTVTMAESGERLVTGTLRPELNAHIMVAAVPIYKSPTDTSPSFDIDIGEDFIEDFIEDPICIGKKCD